MTEKMILSKLDALHEKQVEDGKKINELVVVVNTIAVQQNRLDHVEENLKVLFKIHDDTYKPGGFFSQVKEHQATCPRDEIKWLWRGIYGVAGLSIMGIGLMVTAYSLWSSVVADVAILTTQIKQVIEKCL